MLNNAMTAEDRAALKPGDRVWIGERQHARVLLGTVTKRSRTRVSVSPNPLNPTYTQQFTVETGYRYGSANGYIHLRATPAEVAEWESLKQRESAEREERERERQAIQDTGAALSALFADPVWVGHESEGQWNISNLTGGQVLVCAAALQSPGVPVRLDVEHLEPAEARTLPTIQEMSGLVSDFTEGKTLKDYLESIGNE